MAIILPQKRGIVSTETRIVTIYDVLGAAYVVGAALVAFAIVTIPGAVVQNYGSLSFQMLTRNLVNLAN